MLRCQYYEKEYPTLVYAPHFHIAILYSISREAIFKLNYKQEIKIFSVANCPDVIIWGYLARTAIMPLHVFVYIFAIRYFRIIFCLKIETMHIWVQEIKFQLQITTVWTIFPTM